MFLFEEDFFDEVRRHLHIKSRGARCEGAVVLTNVCLLHCGELFMLCGFLCLANPFVTGAVISKDRIIGASVLYFCNFQTIILVWICPYWILCLLRHVPDPGVAKTKINPTKFIPCALP